MTLPGEIAQATQKLNDLIGAKITAGEQSKLAYHCARIRQEVENFAETLGADVHDEPMLLLLTGWAMKQMEP